MVWLYIGFGGGLDISGCRGCLLVDWAVRRVLPGSWLVMGRLKFDAEEALWLMLRRLFGFADAGWFMLGLMTIVLMCDCIGNVWGFTSPHHMRRFYYCVVADWILPGGGEIDAIGPKRHKRHCTGISVLCS